MRIVFAVAFIAAAAAASSAYAAGGCGVGWHRGPMGGCLRNGGAVVIAPGLAVAPVPGIGVFVEGRGYWDGHRYWGHRYRYHDGWRYR